MSDETIEVRATVALRGLRPGQVVLVDPGDPYVAICLNAEMLVPTGRAVEPTPDDGPS